MSEHAKDANDTAAKAIAEGRDPAEALRGRMAKRCKVETGEPWPEPIPLKGDTGEPPRFPVEALPPWLGDMAAAVAEATQTPPELAGSVGLGVLAQLPQFGGK